MPAMPLMKLQHKMILLVATIFPMAEMIKLDI